MPFDIDFASAGRISPRKFVLIVHAMFMVALVGVGLAYSSLPADIERLVYPSCVLLTLTFGWILGSWFSLRRTLFEPYTLFMIAAGLFNAGQALLEVFGMNPTGILEGRVSPEILVPALYLVTLSAAFLHCGALIALGRSRVRENRLNAPALDRERAARLAGWTLLAVSFVPTLMRLRDSVAVVMDSGYFGLYQGAQALPLNQVFSSFLIPGVIFLLAGSRRQRQTQAACLLVVGIYSAICLFLGARGAAAMSCVTVAWAWDQSVGRIPRKVIVGVALVAVVLFTLIGQTRGLNGRDRSFGNMYGTLMNLGNPIATSISEMGDSLVTVTHTLTLVPAQRSFDAGASYLYALTTIVPNLGWSVHPSIAHGTLSDWLIKAVDLGSAAAGGALGFSFIAEAYLNFGWFGGPVWLGLLGYFIVRIFMQADSADPAKRALVASFLSFFLVFARAESANVVRGLVWFAVIPYLLVTVLTIRKRKQMASVANPSWPGSGLAAYRSGT
jgi:oligosaccharide repeat unit polymerase